MTASARTGMKPISFLVFATALACAFSLFLPACERDMTEEARPPAAVTPEEAVTEAAPEEPEEAEPAPDLPKALTGLPSVPMNEGLDERTVNFTLVYTTAVSGELVHCGCPGHPRGGLARRAKWVMGLDDSRPVVQVDGGDSFFRKTRRGSKVGGDMKARARVLARGMAYMGVDAVNVGVTDLSDGLDFLTGELARPAEDTEVPFVSANLVRADTGERAFPPYRITEVEGAQVCVFGIIDDQDLPADDARALDPALAAKTMVAKLRPRCDLVVGLYGMPFVKATRLAKEVPGVDVVVVGESRSTLKTRPMVIDETILCQAGNRGMYLGRLEMTLRPERDTDLSKEEIAGMKDELQRLAAQIELLEGPVNQNDPALSRVYRDAHRDKRLLENKIAKLHSRFDYKNTLVPMDDDLPEDETVSGWVEAIGVHPPTMRGKGGH